MTIKTSLGLTSILVHRANVRLPDWKKARNEYGCAHFDLRQSFAIF
jgi:hypothetical protein